MHWRFGDCGDFVARRRRRRVALHDDKHVIKVGRDVFGLKRALAVDKHQHNDVVADVSLAMQLLCVDRRVRQKCRHVQHDFEIAKRRKHTVCARAIFAHVQTSAITFEAFQSHTLAQKLSHNCL